MTSAELIQAFKFGMDKFDSFGLPNFQDDEILLMLNQAQDRFVKQRYGETNTKKFGFEEIQKRTEDIKNIVKPITLIPNPNVPDNINPNAQFVDLPSDYWINIFDRALITYPNCYGDPISDECYIKPITHEEYSGSIRNPYTKPYDGKVLRMMVDGKIELIHSSDVTITGYKLRYLRQPVRITSIVTCELSDMVHQEIVSMAISIGLEGIESKRLSTYIPVIQNTNE